MDKQQLTEMVRRVMSENAPSPEVQEVKTSATGGTFEITLDLAKALIDKVLARAKEIGVNAVAAVANSGARPVAVECMDNSYIASYDIALNKAYTSTALKMKTSTLKTLAAPGGSLYGIQHTNNGQIVIFGGGVPLIVGGKVIGGFGVSGGTEEQDTYLGDYAESVFTELISD